MKHSGTILGLALAVIALPAAAQDVAGKWNATMESPMGEMSMSFEFMVESDELKGTTTNDFMGELPISDGKVDGNELSFKVAMEGGPGGAMTMTYTGVLEKDEITLTMGFEDGGAAGGPPGGMPPLTLTRAEE